MKRNFVLGHQQAREGACRAIHEAPKGDVVTIHPPGKTRPQERHYHAQINDIAKQWQFMGRHWHPTDVKRLMVDLFALEMRNQNKPLHLDSRIVPSIDGLRFVQMEIHTSDLWKAEAIEFIEWLYWFGAEHRIEWSWETQSQPQHDRMVNA